MNSRERRKLEAQQHNDDIEYERWLKENTNNPARERKKMMKSYGGLLGFIQCMSILAGRGSIK